MKKPIWISRELVLAVHEEILVRFGGLLGIRDSGLLESALNRPVQLALYSEPSLFELSSAYTAGLIRNCPFVSGNRRVGFVVGQIFLELNGHVPTTVEIDAFLQTLALAAGELDEAGYATWLKKSCRRKRAGKSR